jgi:cobalamin biosynthesis protein CbiG
MMNLFLSSWIYVVLLIVGLAIGVWIHPRLIALWRETKNRLHNQQSSITSANAAGAGVTDQTELALLSRDCLVQITQINTQLSVICKLIEQTQSTFTDEFRLAKQEINTGLLKLLSSNEGFANALQGLLQRNLDAFNVIADQAEAKAGLEVSTPRPSNYVEAPDGCKGMQSVAKVSETQSLAPFDDLIDRIKTQVNQASYKGFKNIQIFLEQIREKHQIDLDSPSDQVFILFDRNAKAEPTGKAFVMPGSYLGRPWVDWFEMPKGVFERVEATVEPATVARDANGGWNLVKPGSLSQQ